MIDIHIHPDVRSKYVVTVKDSPGASDDILLSSTSQGYEDADAPERMVRRLFGGPHAAPTEFVPFDQLEAAVAAVYAAGGGGVPEPVQLTVTYVDGTVRGPERLR